MKRLLIALLTPLFVFPLVAYGQSHSSRLDAKQLAKADRLIHQLELLDAFISSGPAASQYKARLGKLSDAFRGATASLPEGDVKTDMATAVYWYEQLALDLNHADLSKPDGASVGLRCGNERPGAYQHLCESTSGPGRDLLWAKARLHLNWAKAGLTFQMTGKLDRPLDDVAVERRMDLLLAARTIESLKVLESEVLIYRSLADFEASGKPARVSLAVFKQHLQKATADVESDLRWLPQNLLKSDLSNALHSFQDGAFWWEQIDQPRVVKVAELAFRDSSRSASTTVLLTTIPYTVVSNWRHGSRYLRHAEQLMNP